MRVKLVLGHLSSAGLASVVLGWQKLEVLELTGLFEDVGLALSMCKVVQGCPDRQRTLQVKLRVSCFDLRDSHSDAEHKQWWLTKWQQAALRFACGRMKVELQIK